MFKYNIRAKNSIDIQKLEFIKESKFEIDVIFNRYLIFYNIIKKIKNLETPKPLRYNNGEIIFEYIKLGQSLKDIIEDGKYDYELFFKIGRLLGELHLKLNDGNIPENGMICGDFCSWNIFINKKNIYFIDFEPPFRVLNSNILLSDYLNKNTYKSDLAQFIFRLENILIINKPLLFLKSFKKEIKYFLKGYSDITGINISNSMLKLEKKNIAMLEIKSKRNFKNYLNYLITKIVFKVKYFI